ncbi:MAG TPA: molybdate ABC transporter substrate-binding protein [Fimbriimonadales bacterium]|nr:molybdate ABC transporter substrate-binding protein [Fimbriimonadales bacterium]
MIKLYITRVFALWGVVMITIGCASITHHEQNPIGNDKNIEITIAANTDLSNVLKRLSKEYEAENKKVKVHLVFAASGDLRNRAKSDAPFDALIVASPEYLRDLKIVGKPVALAYGRLAIYGDNPPASLDELEDFRGTLLIANPETSPYGELAEKLLKAKLWYEKIKKRIILANNVRDAKLEVDQGKASLGLISLTQALEGQKNYSLIETPLRITITGVALKTGEGEAFLKWLTQPKQQGVFTQYGLSPAHIAEVHRPKGIVK